MTVSADSTMASPIRALMNATADDIVKHPYYPLDANIVDYVANESTVLSLLGSFVAGCVAIFGLTYLAVKRVNPRLPPTELLTVMWFVLCGCIHFFFEGEQGGVGEFEELGTETDLGQVTLRITIPIWADYRHSLVSFGKNTLCQILAI